MQSKYMGLSVLSCLYRCAVLAVMLLGVVAGARCEELAAKYAKEFVASHKAFEYNDKAVELKPVRQSLASPNIELYNVGENAGFVIMDNSGAKPEVIAYSERGNLDANNLPESFVDFIKSYSTGCYAGAAAEREAVAPLIKSTWGQDDPYNIRCMELVEGMYSAGCTPVALSQIMYYYKYPESGLLSARYKSGGNTVDYDLRQIRFDWDNMLSNYVGSESGQARNAVAELMFCVGLTLPMGHSVLPWDVRLLPYSETASLREYFGYSRNIKHIEHKYYDDEAWDNIIYYELSQARPVYFASNSNIMGHSYICDGYEDGYFHFNWGWNGYLDGYYRLPMLQPKDETGGDIHYKYNTSAVIGIVPEGMPANPNPYSTEDFTVGAVSDFEYDRTSESLKLSCERGDIKDFTGFVALKVCSKGKDNARYFGEQSLVIGNNHQTSFSIKTDVITALGDGEYIVTPVWRTGTSNTWTDFAIPILCRRSVRLLVAGGVYSFENTESTHKYDLRIKAVKPCSTIFSGRINDIMFDVANTGTAPFESDVWIKFYDRGSLLERNETLGFGMKVLNGEAGDIVLNIFVDVAPGRYDAVVVDGKGNPISDRFSLDIYSDTDVFVFEGNSYLRTYNKDNARLILADGLVGEGLVHIPSSVQYGGKDLKVTEIDGYAFKNIQGDFVYVVPESVQYIGYKAFGGFVNGVVILSEEIELMQPIFEYGKVYVRYENYDKLKGAGLKDGMLLFSISNSFDVENVPAVMYRGDSPKTFKVNFDTFYCEPYMEVSVNGPGAGNAFCDYESGTTLLHIVPGVFDKGVFEIVLTSHQPFPKLSKSYKIEFVDGESGVDVVGSVGYELDIQGRDVYFRGVGKNDVVTVSDVWGRVYKVSDSGVRVFHAPSAGVYIAKIAGRSYKFVVV